MPNKVLSHLWKYCAISSFHILKGRNTVSIPLKGDYNTLVTLARTGQITEFQDTVHTLYTHDLFTSVYFYMCQYTEKETYMAHLKMVTKECYRMKCFGSIHISQLLEYISSVIPTCSI